MNEKIGCIEKKNERSLSAEKLRKIAEITDEIFSDFLGDVLGFCMDLEGFAALVGQRTLHHRLF